MDQLHRKEKTMDNDENTSTDEMSKKLKAAGKKAEKVKTERQARAVKGGHLNPTFLKMAEERGMEIEEKSGFLKVFAAGRSAKLYVAKKGGRVDLSFSFDAPGVKNLTEEEAKARHLGKVRGQLDFEQGDETLTEAFAGALAFIQASPEVTARPARKPKVETEAVSTEGDAFEGEETRVDVVPETEAAAG